MELRHLNDAVLLARLEALAAQERGDAADIVEHLAEVDRREIVIDAGFSTLFEYCVKTLRYSEAAAFLRIRAARAAAEFPRVLDDLRSGTISLDSVMRISPHLNAENSDRLLDLASGATKREVLALVASIDPSAAAPERDVMRPLPPASVAQVNSAPGSDPAASTAPSGPVSEAPSGPVSEAPSGPVPEVIPPASRVRVAFTSDNEFMLMVDRLRGLRRHKFPDGRLEDLLKEAVAAMLGAIDPGRPVRPRRREERKTGTRWVSNHVKKEVWTRDAGRCAFIAPDGRRCESRERLEYDHVIPYALGGRSDRAENIRLLCRPHNQRLGRRRFGPRRRAD